MGLVRNSGVLLAGLSIASAARATLTISFKPVPISAGAMADDPQLRSTTATHPLARTFEMDITQSGGEELSVATMRTTLSSGSFYIPTSNNSDVARPDIWNNVGSRNLQNDTFVTMPHGSSSTLFLGKSDYPTNQTGNAIMPGLDAAYPKVDSSPITIDVSWGDQAPLINPMPDGTYMVARVTTLGMASGTILGHFTGTQHVFTAENYYATISLPKPFDFNDDGSVDAGDIDDAIEVVQGDISDYLAGHPELSGDASYAQAVGDLNGDGLVNKADIADYVYVLQSQGVSQSQIAPLAALAPEPGTFLLASLAGIGLLRRVRR